MASRRESIELHGWDPDAAAWHGPHELECRVEGCGAILSRLRQMPGSWYGKLNTRVPGGPGLSFCACMHDLGDAGLAALDLEGTPGGPLETLLVVPAHRRPRLRPELAFEYVSFVRFLQGPESDGTEAVLHDYIERVLRESTPGTSLVFAVERGGIDPEVHIALCAQADRLAACMAVWMREKDSHA